MAHEEYLRRNLVHAGSIGVRAGIGAALSRLRKTKNPPKWILVHLDNLIERADNSSIELAAWRNTAPDAPAKRFDDGPIPIPVGHFLALRAENERLREALTEARDDLKKSFWREINRRTALKGKGEGK